MEKGAERQSKEREINLITKWWILKGFWKIQLRLYGSILAGIVAGIKVVHVVMFSSRVQTVLFISGLSIPSGPSSHILSAGFPCGSFSDWLSSLFFAKVLFLEEGATPNDRCSSNQWQRLESPTLTSAVINSGNWKSYFPPKKYHFSFGIFIVNHIMNLNVYIKG